MNDSPGPRPIRIPVVDVPGPRKLRALVKELSRRSVVAPRPELLQEARELLGLALEGREVSITRPRLARAMVALLDELRSAEARERVADLVMKSGLAQPRALFILWQEVDGRRPEIGHALHGPAADMPSPERRGDLGFLPQWIPRLSNRTRLAVLTAPHARFLEHLFTRTRRLSKLDDALDGISPSSSLGTELLAAGLRKSSAEWWRGLGAPRNVRAWAGSRPEQIQAVIAERQLLAIRKETLNIIELTDEPEAQALTAWIVEFLGDPEEYPARWEDISAEAQEVFEWLLVRNEILKILDAFRRGATKRERAEFWAEYAPKMRDARYVEIDGTAVCMMVIGGVFIIEFGDVGNAAYIYRKPDTLPPLRRLEGLPRTVLRYKDRIRLRLLGHSFEHLDRIIHNGRWEGGAHSKIRRYGGDGPAPRRDRAEARIEQWATRRQRAASRQHEHARWRDREEPNRGAAGSVTESTSASAEIRGIHQRLDEARRGARGLEGLERAGLVSTPIYRKQNAEFQNAVAAAQRIASAARLNGVSIRLDGRKLVVEDPNELLVVEKPTRPPELPEHSQQAQRDRDETAATIVTRASRRPGGTPREARTTSRRPPSGDLAGQRPRVRPDPAVLDGIRRRLDEARSALKELKSLDERNLASSALHKAARWKIRTAVNAARKMVSASRLDAAGLAIQLTNEEVIVIDPNQILPTGEEH